MKRKIYIHKHNNGIVCFYRSCAATLFPKPDKSKNIPFGKKQPAPSWLSDDQKNLLKTLYPGADKLPNSDALFAGIKKSATVSV